MKAALHPFRHGWRWQVGSIMFCERWAEEDKTTSAIEITRRIIHASMNGIESFLEITTETEEEFDGWLPTLDTNITVNKENLVFYKFYEKPMASNTVLHFRTAMPEDAKIRSLSNELTRRMMTTSERVDIKVRRQIVDEYTQKLLNSGYSFSAIRKIVIAGLKGYEKKVYNSLKPGGQKLRRTSKESSHSRAQKKLTAKTEWFREGKRNRDDLEDSFENDQVEVTNYPKRRRMTGERQDEQLPKGWKPEMEQRNNTEIDKTMPEGWKPNKKEIKTRSLLFVIGSRKGELASNLRKVTERMKQIVGYNTKVVERGGRKLNHLLSNTNPWKGLPCGREECQPCGQPSEKKDDCRKRSIIYENTCKKCNPGDMQDKKKDNSMEDTRPEPSIYVGESSRSLHERAGDHWRGCKNKLDESHM